ncbi:MAG: BlaI/MecI/CopY family transcriptional regulator [Lachnospiraceae bacterium]|nr:BlaI/MecI/CopY family transcriptional regulator [Lachnospiraceae bacterium]
MERLSECELLVMKCIWDHSDHQMVLSEIVVSLAEEYNRVWNPNTVSTFLTRLIRKGYLNSTRKGRYFFYHILVSEADYRNSMIDDRVNLWFGGDTTAFITFLLDYYQLSDDQLAVIEKKVKSLKSKKTK